MMNEQIIFFDDFKFIVYVLGELSGEECVVVEMLLKNDLVVQVVVEEICVLVVQLEGVLVQEVLMDFVVSSEVSVGFVMEVKGVKVLWMVVCVEDDLYCKKVICFLYVLIGLLVVVCFVVVIVL